MLYIISIPQSSKPKLFLMMIVIMIFSQQRKPYVFISQTPLMIGKINPPLFFCARNSHTRELQLQERCKILRCVYVCVGVCCNYISGWTCPQSSRETRSISQLIKAFPLTESSSVECTITRLSRRVRVRESGRERAHVRVSEGAQVTVCERE